MSDLCACHSGLVPTARMLVNGVESTQCRACYPEWTVVGETAASLVLAYHAELQEVLEMCGVQPEAIARMRKDFDRVLAAVREERT